MHFEDIECSIKMFKESFQKSFEWLMLHVKWTHLLLGWMSNRLAPLIYEKLAMKYLSYVPLRECYKLLRTKETHPVQAYGSQNISPAPTSGLIRQISVPLKKE